MLKALLDGRSIPPVLGPSLFKYLLGESPSVSDLAPFHPQLAAALKGLLELNWAEPAGAAVAEAVAEVQRLSGGPSSEGGEGALEGGVLGGQAPTSREEAEEYAQAVAEWLLVGARKAQLEELKNGFCAVDLSGYLPVFSARDLIFLFTNPA
eukprot:1191223-Prorocentrum_minimum.AAC.1